MPLRRLLLWAPLLLRLAAASLGPGRGTWHTERPERHGLSGARLARAAEEIGRRVAERYCLVVAKDGRLVHETYYSNTSETVYEADSLGKSFTAAVMGVAVQEGLLDLDRPIRDYGVQPNADWAATGPDFFPHVTVRTLLAQSSGYGVVMPGTRMTYDSDDYIQHLSATLTAVSNLSSGALEYATEKFARPLGIPDLFAYDAMDSGRDFSAGGGQMVSCRDVARVGQLVLNKGEWLDETNTPYPMASRDYMEQMVRSAYPGVIDSYGFLTWLNVDQRKPGAAGQRRSHCCGPRWSFGVRGRQCRGWGAARRCGTCCRARDGYNASRVPCDLELPVLQERPPPWLPRRDTERDVSEYVTGQILGDSFPDVDKVPYPEELAFGMGLNGKYLLLWPSRNLTIVTLGNSFGTSLGCEAAYDDGFTLSLVWRALAPALEEDHELKTQSAAAAPDAAPAPFLGVPRAVGDRTHATLRAARGAYGAAAPAGDRVAGSCTCSCPGAGYGKCFNILKSTLKAVGRPFDGMCGPNLQATFGRASDFCPETGFLFQCAPEDEGKDMCSDGALTKCTRFPGAKELASANCRQRVGAQWRDGCYWSKEICQYSPYYPP